MAGIEAIIACGANASKQVQNQKAQQEPKNQEAPKKQDNEPSIGQKLVGKAATLVMSGPVFGASLIYLGLKSFEGLVTNKSYDEAMTEGIKDVSQGAEMLEDMWNGKYF